jgi:F-type H+-transporting ATPase subunit b
MLLMAASAGAFVEEHGGGGEPSLFAGDVGNAIWTLVIFLLVVAVLGKFAWGPLLGSLQQREQFIRNALADAKRDRDAAEVRLAEYTDRLNEARSEATEIVDEGRRDAEVVKGRIEREAREEGDRMIERAKREIELAKSAAIKELYGKTAQLATEIATQVVRREISAADHQRLIAEALEDLEDQELH